MEGTGVKHSTRKRWVGEASIKPRNVTSKAGGRKRIAGSASPGGWDQTNNSKRVGKIGGGGEKRR